MKRFKRFSVIGACLIGFAISASAQIGFDSYWISRTVILAPAQNITGGTAGNITNQPVDIRVFNGVARLDISGFTNTYGGTMTATLQSSIDTTNWTTLSNYYATASTSVVYTNNYYGGTNLFATNTWLLTGTYTTPTASTAGFATPYMAPMGATNGPNLTVSSGNYVIGLNADSQQRYLRVIFTPGGTATNWSGSVVLTCRTHGEIK